MKFLSPNALLVLLAFSGDFANKTKTKHNNDFCMNSFLIQRSIILYNFFIRRLFFSIILFFYFTVIITLMFTSLMFVYI